MLTPVFRIELYAESSIFQSATPSRLAGQVVHLYLKLAGTQGMEGLENTTVTAIDQLATLYARPSERVLRKEIDHVDAMGRAFIAASPFLILATGSTDGLDCSPKGDKPGFVQVEDDGRTLLIPDRRGNNRIDVFRLRRAGVPRPRHAVPPARRSIDRHEDRVPRSVAR
jgi:hypothetical protein